MQSKLKYILSIILKKSFGDSLASKPYGKTKYVLYYEKAQHLTFAFQKRLSYEATIQNKIEKYCQNAHLIFDIGGNIGQYALLFSELANENGKIISVEPDYKNYSFLQFNVNINNIHNVLCLKKGISDSPSITEFYRDTETGGRTGSFNRKYVGDNFKGKTETVETITLDQMIAEFGEPQFIKVDVEGFEGQVIRGLTAPLGKTVFLVEVREETKREIFDYFKERGYVCFYIDKREDVSITTSDMIPGFANLLFLRK